MQSSEDNTMHQDPVCKMKVQADTPYQYLYEGNTYLFCSARCKNLFKYNPHKYISHSEPENRPIGTEYTCPIHPDIKQKKPRSCPKCGMALEPVNPLPAGTKSEWTCPMHPQIIRQAPGSCPICGMALEPRTVMFEQSKNPELQDMQRRFLISTFLTVPLLIITMIHLFPGMETGLITYLIILIPFFQNWYW